MQPSASAFTTFEVSISPLPVLHKTHTKLQTLKLLLTIRLLVIKKNKKDKIPPII